MSEKKAEKPAPALTDEMLQARQEHLAGERAKSQSIVSDLRRQAAEINARADAEQLTIHRIEGAHQLTAELRQQLAAQAEAKKEATPAAEPPPAGEKADAAN